MSGTPPRAAWSWWRVLGIVTAVGALSCASLITGLIGLNIYLSQPCHPTPVTHVTAPGPDTPPQQVVLTLIETLNVGDYATSANMMTPAQYEQVLETPSWYEATFAPSYLGNICTATNIEINRVVAEEPWVAAESGFRDEVVVEVSYNLELREAADMPDDTDGNGRSNDRYYLARNTHAEPWIVVCARCHG